jgi:hypothetical protein
VPRPPGALRRLTVRKRRLRRIGLAQQPGKPIAIDTTPQLPAKLGEAAAESGPAIVSHDR